TSQTLKVFVQFERITSRSWPEHCSPSFKQRTFYTSCTSCTCTLLFFNLTSTSCYLISLFRFMSTLSLVSQILFNIQVNSVFVWLYSENRIRQCYCSSGFFTTDI